MVTKSNSGYWSFAVDGFVFLDIKGNRYTMVRGLENPCLLTSLWNWLGPLWRVDELLYLSLLVLSKLLLPQLYFRIRAFVCVSERALVYYMYVSSCGNWHCCKTWYHPHRLPRECMRIRKRRYTKSPAVFNTGTDFSNRPLFSNRDNTARIMCVYFRNDILRSWMFRSFFSLN